MTKVSNLVEETIRTKSPIRGKQSRQRRGYERTREKLINAARSVLTERGLSASVDEITQRADVARGSFYYHFKSKGRLISLLVDDILAKLTQKMNDECSNKKGLESMLDGIIQVHIKFFSERWEDFVLYYQGRADLTLDDSYDGLEKPFLKYAKSIEKLLDASISEPISDTRLRRVANAIAGFISGYYSFASVASPEQDIDKEFQSLRTAFVTSLARFAREAMPESQVKW
ncbi:MAG: TetR/AcrR family transcriptional regulator [Candidatus Zixiibacteriota bacterium]